MAMDQASCPTCQKPLESAGRTERCATCDGAWIHEDVLVGMLQESTSTLVFLPWHPREVGEHDRVRNCALCEKAMQPVKLGSIALDRCPEHGVWFDAHELSELFHEAKQLAQEGRAKTNSGEDHAREPGHSGLLGAIARLFGG